MSKFKISIRGYGGEVTIGAVTEEEKAILSNPDKDIYELVNEDLEEICSWTEIDDQFHCFGATSPSVPVTGGTPYPVTVGPGGFVTISWNPQ